MSKEFPSLRQVHFDVLQEMGNIGAGNAVTSLSKMLGHKVDMSVPVVNLLPFDKIADFVGGPENIVVGILVNITGQINGIMMFIVERESARKLINVVMKNMSHPESEDFSEIELSALKEIGNILSSSYLGALSALINQKITPSVPYLAVDMANAILSVPAIEFSKIADKALFIESIFGGDDDDADDVSGFFILVPDMPSFDLILSSLGVM